MINLIKNQKVDKKMIKKQTEYIPETCDHNIIKSNGYFVCSECGQVFNPVFSNSLTKNDYYRNFKPSEYKISKSDTLGSRLAKINFYYTVKSSPEYRIEKILLTICNKLEIPKSIKESAFYRYRKLCKLTKISNNITCIAFCLWDSIKHYNYPLTLKELSRAFKNETYRVKPGFILRSEMKYKPLLHSTCRKNSKTKGPLQYLTKLINSLRENEDMIQKRLELKGITNYNTIEDFFLELERMSITIITKLSFQWTFSGVHPVNYTASVLYLASELLAVKCGCTRYLLTQSILSTSMGICEYSIRSLYNKYLKQYNPRALQLKKSVKHMQILRIDDIEKVEKEKLAKLLKFLVKEQINFDIFDMVYIGEN